MELNKDDEKFALFEFEQVRLILLFVFTCCLTSFIICMGLFGSTEISGYNLQNLYQPVNRSSCTCDCWDGFYRGPYGRGGYKTFYFNYDKQMILIFGLVYFYSELLRQYLLKFIEKRSILFLITIPSAYANFYGIWSIINYLNDQDYDRMLKSQTFFSVTELLCAFLLLQLVASSDFYSTRPSILFFLALISSVHIVLALNELNLAFFQRNFFLILPDFIQLILVSLVLKNNPRRRPSQRTIFQFLLSAILLYVFYRKFCPFRE